MFLECSDIGIGKSHFARTKLKKRTFVTQCERSDKGSMGQLVRSPNIKPLELNIIALASNST